MSPSLKYVPIFRGRQEELKVLKSFNFGERIFPCLEIIKGPVKPKTFEDTYLPVIGWAKARRVFVDLPVHLKILDEMKPDTLTFLTAITDMKIRTAYLKTLKLLPNKVIPVISTYVHIKGAPGSITAQATALRKIFPVLAFRTFMNTFNRDLPQIQAEVTPQDFIMMDWEESELDDQDGDQMDIVASLARLNCTVIVHRNPFPPSLTNSGLHHGTVIHDIDNCLLNKYSDFGGSCFSDYAGIKKDSVVEGGTISPGFIYYDAIDNEFCGFRYKNGGHKKDQVKPQIQEFETTIVPAVISSDASRRMMASPLKYLSNENSGWQTLKNIEKHLESGLNQAKFKRISMGHYLHCIKTRIENKDFG
jgi:hypothetical protein